ncbi:YhfC family glutamic-type intramembrane protease [Bacillus sp. FJAT-42315]|uniref:YhfC family glutamic-type intramembrane protease n=1 Tax=Bacillus sp. FJAT-42315 TaxID=2014077 RepID=UPI000C232196|nr:YhfC family glutamic-type intramembrane protease [Bacillus sp. FJAT-42315]
MAGVVFGLLIGMMFPLAALFYCLINKRYFRPYLLGVLAFIISQMLLRLPLLQWLSGNVIAYDMFRATQPFFFALGLGFSAGIFEGIARYIAMKYFMKNHRAWDDGIVFGIGHGGIEAVLFLGMSALTSLFSPTMWLMHGTDYFIGGIERLFAILLHVGLSILVLKGVASGQIKYLLYAIVIHGMIDSFVGIVPLLITSSTSIIVIEGLLMITSIFLFAYCMKLRKNWSVVK